MSYWLFLAILAKTYFITEKIIIFVSAAFNIGTVFAFTKTQFNKKHWGRFLISHYWLIKVLIILTLLLTKLTWVSKNWCGI